MCYPHPHFLVSKFRLSVFLSPLKCVGLEINSFFFLHRGKKKWEQAQAEIKKAITERTEQLTKAMWPMPLALAEPITGRRALSRQVGGEAVI